MDNRYKISGDIENILTRRTTSKKSVKKSSKLRRKPCDKISSASSEICK